MSEFRVRGASQVQVVVDGQQTVRLHNAGPDTLYYGRTRALAAARGTSLASGSSVELIASQWLESAGVSNVLTSVLDAERDEVIDPSTGKLKESRVPDSVVTSSWTGLAAQPDLLITGTITRDVDGAALSADVVWPDGDEGTYTGTASTEFPGAIDSYTITKEASPTITFTQPTMTRDANGAVTVRPTITVA